MLLTDLNLTDNCLEAVSVDWEKSLKSMPQEIPFLEKSEYMRCYKMTKAADDLKLNLMKSPRKSRNLQLLKHSSGILIARLLITKIQN